MLLLTTKVNRIEKVKISFIVAQLLTTLALAFIENKFVLVVFSQNLGSNNTK